MNDSTNAVSDALGAAANAMTDSMVERLATTVSNAAEIADRLNDPETREAVDALLAGITALHRTGDLAATFELLHVLGAMRSAATDSMIERAASLLEHLLSNMANEEVADLAHETKEAMREARHEAAAAPARGGLMATLGLLSKPETQEALRFLVTITNKMKARP